MTTATPERPSNDDSMPGSLTMEQQFKLKTIENNVRGASPEALRGYVVELSAQLMRTNNLWMDLIKQGDRPIMSLPEMPNIGNE